MKQKRPDIHSIIALIAESTVTKILALAAGFLALFSLEFGDAPLAVKVVGIASILILSTNVLLAGLRRLSLEAFDTRSSELDPFGLAPNWTAWERNRYVKSILARLEEQVDKHILLIGPTGAGKSILLKSLLPKRLPKYKVVGPITEFQNVPQKILLSIATEFPESELSKLSFEITEAISSGSEVRVANLVLDLPELIRDAIGNSNIIFLFDQVERYLVFSQKLSMSDPKQFEMDTDLIRAILRGIRLTKSARTLFAIRSEFFFGSIGNLFNTGKDGKGLEDVVEFHFMWGINEEDDSNIFSEMANILDEEFGTGGEIPLKIAETANFKSRLNADSFALRLGAFLYLELYKRRKYQDLLNHAHSVDDFVDILLDASFEGSSKQISTLVADRTIFDSVLFSIAAENQSTGHGCSIERVAGLSHFPKSDVSVLLDYLSEIGILSKKFEDKVEIFRLIHDKIADRLLKSEKLEIHSRALNAMRSLTENEAETSFLTTPPHYPASIEVNRLGLLNLSYLSIVVFAMFGIIRMFFSEELFKYFSQFYSLLGNSIYLIAPNYYVDPLYYVPHFVTHLIWVSYIDRMYRSFLVNTGDELSKVIGILLSSIGVSFGIFVAFLPQLFVLPLVVVGLLFGFALVRTSNRKEFVGEIRIVTKHWGVRTALNMSVLLILGLATAPWFVDINSFFAGSDSTWQNTKSVYFIMIVIESFFLLWFWQHIRPEQNTTRIWSANLALFDKGRLTQRPAYHGRVNETEI